MSEGNRGQVVDRNRDRGIVRPERLFLDVESLLQQVPRLGQASHLAIEFTQIAQGGGDFRTGRPQHLLLNCDGAAIQGFGIRQPVQGFESHGEIVERDRGLVAFGAERGSRCPDRLLGGGRCLFVLALLIELPGRCGQLSPTGILSRGRETRKDDAS